jgi:electron transfer flavoprotein alpha subunit
MSAIADAAHQRKNVLVIAEHDGGRIRQATLAALGGAQELATLAGSGSPPDVCLLVMGHEIAPVAEAARDLGVSRVLVADHPALSGALADRTAPVVRAAVEATGATWVVAASSTFSKDLLPRVAALLDAGMLSDVLGFEVDGGGEIRFRRPVYAGNAIATVTLDGPIRVLTLRPTAFSAARSQEPGVRSPIDPIDVAAVALLDASEFVSRSTSAATRPELTEARVVVTGGRPLRDAETYERLIGGLADLLGGAAGATRAAVDQCIAPNDLQVGQTGKVVAPELYIACGVSGSIQHLAGMKDSRIVVAINKDPEAPIFDIADYGLVADLHQAVPEMIELLRKDSGV